MSGPESAPVRRRVKRVRKAIAAIVFWAMGRGLVSAARLDSKIRAELLGWPDPCTVTLAIAPDGPRVTWLREGETLRYLGLGARDDGPDLLVTFKSVDGALPVLLGIKPVLGAFAEHRAYVRGDLAVAMSLVRCLHGVEAYLFPGIMTRRILPRPFDRETGHTFAYLALVHTRAALVTPDDLEGALP